MKKLSLNKETLRCLIPEYQRLVMGGFGTTQNPRVCDTDTGGSGVACGPSAVCKNTFQFTSVNPQCDCPL